jgi:molecular chaperone GrpE
MLAKLERWLWKDTLETDLRPFEVLSEVATGTEDLIRPLNLEVQRLVRDIEDAREALEKRRALDSAGTAPAPQPAGGDNLRQFARSLLPTLDALDRIIEFGEESDRQQDEVFQNWLTAVKALRTRITKTLEGIGLVPLSSIGTEVDLNVHDVVAVMPTREFPPNTVIAERQKGYYFKGKLLRDAKVVVAQ